MSEAAVGIAGRLGAGLRALFDSSDHVGRGQFDKFTKQLLSGQSAILGMSWIPRVSAEQRAALERDAALDGVPGYRIKSVAADGTLRQFDAGGAHLMGGGVSSAN